MDEANQVIAKVETHEIDIEAFRAGLFICGPNILSPVSWTPAIQGTVNLREACEQGKDAKNSFIPWAIAGGIGLYSLAEHPAGLITRWDVFFRHAVASEAEEDFAHFGEQVMGPEVGKGEDGKYKGHAKIKCFRKEFYYTGPERVLKSVFSTRVFQGALPSKERFAEFVKQIDGLAEKVKSESGNFADGIACQGYMFFHADAENIYHAGFKNLVNYNPGNMKLWATLKLRNSGKTLDFYPEGNKAECIDYSICLENLPIDFRTKLYSQRQPVNK